MAGQPEVVVVGGGPAGSVAATVLAQHGRRVRVFERSGAARFHVGESLVPHTYWTLQRIGMIDKLKRSRFPRKYSVQFITADGRESRPFFFFETNPHESAITWQVWRARFDRMLLENAAEKGAEVVRGARVLNVNWEGGRARGVAVLHRDGRREDVAAEVVIDAAGQSSPLAVADGNRRQDPYLKNAAVWSYFKDAKQGRGIEAGATLVVSVGQRGWFWFIPMPGGVVSIGAVASFDYLLGRGLPHEEIFARELADCPGLQSRMKDARRVKPFYATKDFSYLTARPARDGYVMAGDAAGFIDPLYSSGLMLAMKSGELAADAVHGGLAAGDVSEARIGAWHGEHEQALASFRALVYAFYSAEFRFGPFLRARPEFKKDVIDILSGDVYGRDYSALLAAIGHATPTHRAAALAGSAA